MFFLREEGSISVDCLDSVLCIQNSIQKFCYCKMVAFIIHDDV